MWRFDSCELMCYAYRDYAPPKGDGSMGLSQTGQVEHQRSDCSRERMAASGLRPCDEVTPVRIIRSTRALGSRGFHVIRCSLHEGCDLDLRTRHDDHLFGHGSPWGIAFEKLRLSNRSVFNFDTGTKVLRFNLEGLMTTLLDDSLMVPQNL